MMQNFSERERKKITVYAFGFPEMSRKISKYFLSNNPAASSWNCHASVGYVGKGQATISRRSVPAIYWDAGVKARNNDKMILPEGEARSTSSQSSLLHS